MSLNNLIKDPLAITSLIGHKRAVLTVDFSRETNQLASGSEDNSVIVWNLPDNIDDISEQKQTSYALYGHKNSIMSVAFGCGYLVSASKDGQTKLWKMDSSVIPTNPQCYSYSSNSTTVRSVACSRENPLFCTACDDKSIKIWSANSQNKMVQSLTNGHKNWIKCVKWSKCDPNLIASCGDDGLLCIWDTRKPSRQPPVATIAACRKGMHFNCLDWHPIFHYNIVTGGKDSTCVIWDLRVNKQIQLYSEHVGAVNSVAFNERGNFLISGSTDTTAKMFDILEGRLAFTLKVHDGPVNAVALNGSGDTFVTASEDKSIMIWKSNIEPVRIVVQNEDEQDEQDEQSALFIDNNINYDDSENKIIETNTQTCSCGKLPTESASDKFSQILDLMKLLNTKVDLIEQKISVLEQKEKVTGKQKTKTFQ